MQRSSLGEYLKYPLRIQMCHVAISVVWILYSIYLKSKGLTTPGPVASWQAIFIVGSLFALLLIGVSWPRLVLLYVAGCLGFGYIGVTVIYSAFTKDPTLWASEAWRYASVILQAVGLIGAASGVAQTLRYRLSNASV